MTTPTPRRTRRRAMVAGSIAMCAAALSLVTASASTAEAKNDLATARAGTAPFHLIGTAADAGYGLFTDAAGIACIDNPAGGMGVHFVKGSLVGDGQVDAATPEALVYEPTANGRMRLVAVEYVVFKDAWDASHDAAPSLFGQDFEEVPAVNRYGLPPFYELHAWIWKNNPKSPTGESNMFNDWNPEVTCANA